MAAGWSRQFLEVLMAETLKPITVWVTPQLLDEVGQLARRDRRPASQLIRNFIQDAVEASRRADVREMSHA